MRGLRDKVIVIAGGGSGIGAATALRFGEEGAKVVVGDLNGPNAEAIAQQVRRADGIAISVPFDISDEGSVLALAGSAASEFGGIDAWHNNAGATSAEVGGVDFGHDALGLPMEVWQRTFAVNATGFLFGIRAAVPELLKRGGGVIINTVADGAFVGWPNITAYNASKSAVLSLTRHVATRWGKEGIRCNAVSPGIIMTEGTLRALADNLEEIKATHHSPRLGEPSDVASAVAFLASDDASWINGQVLSVNGGVLMR